MQQIVTIDMKDNLEKNQFKEDLLEALENLNDCAYYGHGYGEVEKLSY